MGQQESKVVMAKNIINTLVISHVVHNGRGITRLIDVDRQNIIEAYIKILLNITKDAFWLNYKRAKWSKSLLESLKKKVID
jgi:hypothetical protein